MAEVASAYVSIIPSARGFGRSLDTQISGGVASSGKKAGVGFGKLFAIGAAIGLGTKLVGFLGDSIEEAKEAEVVGKRTTNVIKSMGLQSDVTAEQIGNLAAKLSLKTGVDDEAIQAGENLLLTFKNVAKSAGDAGGVFEKATALSLDMSKALGTDLKGASIQVGKALNDPIKGVSALTRVGVSFTEQQKTQIAKFVESGDTMKAQGIILGELTKQFGGAGAAMATPGEKAKVAFDNLKETVGTALLPTLNRFQTFLYSSLIPAVVAAGGWVRENLGPAFRKIATFVQDQLIPALRVLAEKYVQGLSSAFAELSRKGNDGKSTLDDLRAAFNAVWPVIRDKVLPVVGEFFKVYLPLLAKHITITISVVQTLIGVVRTVGGAFIEAGQKAAQFVAAVREKFNAAVDFIQGIPGKIRAAFSGAATMLYQAGRDIVSGLINGIKAMASAAASAAVDVVTGALNAAKSKLGIHSPSTVFAEVGRNTMEGLAQGISQGSKLSEDAMRNALDRLKGQLSTMRSDFASLSGSVASAFTGDLFGAEATDAIAEVRDALGNITTAAAPAKSASQNFMAGLFGTSGTLTGLVAAFKKLTGLGYGAGFLAQLFQSGNASLILDLAATGSSAQAAEVNTLFGGIETMSSKLGNSVADNKLGDKMTDVRDQIKVLQKDVRDLAPAISGALNGAHANGHKNGKRT